MAPHFHSQVYQPRNILTGYPLSLADSEIIDGDLKGRNLFQNTVYPRFHTGQSIDYCDRLGVVLR